MTRGRYIEDGLFEEDGFISGGQLWRGRFEKGWLLPMQDWDCACQAFMHVFNRKLHLMCHAFSGKRVGETIVWKQACVFCAFIYI